MEQKGLVKSSINLPGFVEDAYNSVEAMTKFSDLLLESKLCPDHFYEKSPDGKADYTKGKTAAVMMVLLQGHQLNLPPLTALQHIIPVNGLLSIKGDAAKTLIFNSGKLEPGTWKEMVSGKIQDGTYECTITAERSDTKEVMSRSFSVTHAKRAGLWIDESKIRGNDGWKYQKSAWYKYPERMIAYRALGFLARDLFPDVLSGIYTTEEAIDMPVDTTVVIETTSGTEVKIPDKSFATERSQKLTSKAAELIDKKTVKEDPLFSVKDDKGEEVFRVDQQKTPDPDEAVETKPERGQSKTMLNGSEGAIPVYDEKELMELPLEELHAMIESDGLMTHARDIDPSKNTNKKLRTIILAHYAGETVGLIEKFDPEDGSPAKEVPPKQEDEQVEIPGQEHHQEHHDDEIPMEALPDQDEDQSMVDPNEGIEPNKSFASQPDPEIPLVDNKFEIHIPELVEGKRPFDVTKTLYEETLSIAGLSNERYLALIETKFPQFQKYRSREDFCYKATNTEINTLLNSL